jgi:tungstate transport system substrate-binding protein
MPRRLFLVAAPAAFARPARGEERFVTIASTTSTEQSGLFRHLRPLLRQETGIALRVLALGTGQALDVGRRGDADVVFVHDCAAEERFVAEGFGGPRRHVMFNDFLLAGPEADPARVAGLGDAGEALRRIAAARAPFVSRGDRSGTHAAEMRLWREAGTDPTAGRGRWYREVGQGMGPALNTAAAQGAYVLTDRATWLGFRNRQGLRLVVQGDARLFNQYGAIPVSAERHPHVKAAEGRRFVEWIVSPAGQRSIAEFRLQGEAVFFPNAAAPEPRRACAGPEAERRPGPDGRALPPPLGARGAA